MQIFAVANQKGGVGKTTTAVNMACCVAAEGKKVLLCDLDPQGNATTSLGVEPRRGKTVYEAIIGAAEPAQAVEKTRWCLLMPSDIRLAAAEQELPEIENWEKSLRRVLEVAAKDVDYVFIDCPPSLGLLTISALNAADKVIVPMQCEYFALEGLSRLTDSIRRVRRASNPELDVEGIILTMYDGRTNLTIQVAEEVKKYFGRKVYHTPVPRNVRLSEAPSYGLPIIAYDRASRGAEAYRALAREFIQRNG